MRNHKDTNENAIFVISKVRKLQDPCIVEVAAGSLYTNMKLSAESPLSESRIFDVFPADEEKREMTETAEMQKPGRGGFISDWDLDVNMSELTEDTKSNRSSEKILTISPNETFSTLSQAPTRKESACSTIPDTFTFPDFLNDKKVPPQKKKIMPNWSVLENKEFYLIDKTKCFPKVYNKNIEVEEFNEDVYFNFS